MEEFTIKKPTKPRPEDMWLETMECLIFEGKPFIAEVRLFDQEMLYGWLKSIHTNKMFNYKEERYEDFWVDDLEPAYLNPTANGHDESSIYNLERTRVYLNLNIPNFEEEMTCLANAVYKKKDKPLRKMCGSNSDFNDSMLIALTMLYQNLQHINQIYRILNNLNDQQEIHYGVCECLMDEKMPFAFRWIQHCLCCYREEIKPQKFATSDEGEGYSTFPEGDFIF
ncbi:hypothetical protein HZU75_16270 [Chitinibacter fontanus]|uniref:Uncharacterized protein n=1 Tax=Chitinibacter fontanus TaxID=1737446 RepID=A0A7D5ZJL5_9NEIS|nr:hypothetical protein [Chitinibacter fontanus]QLI82949.1 hypothetical protein HZU75_16270 [Chitinibacter fontanus]